MDRQTWKDLGRVAVLAAIVLIVLKVGSLAPQAVERVRDLVPLFLPPTQDISTDTATSSLPLSAADGYTLSVYADGFEKPRDLERGPAGRLLLTDTEAGQVLALPDADADGLADTKQVLFDGLRQPHGLATYCKTVSMHDQRQRCWLYVAETHQVRRFEYDFQTETFGAGQHIMDLPGGGRHYTRSLQFAPAAALATSSERMTRTGGPQRLLISVGSSCNVCFENSEKRAAVLSVRPDGSDMRIIEGLRNAVFMSRHPATGEVWVTEMGRDHLGDTQPPDEINILTHSNHYGHPVCYGDNTYDSQFDAQPNARQPCADMTPARLNLIAHVAPLGIDFVPERGWPANTRHDAVVALHGSWNRTDPVGYRVVRYDVQRVSSSSQTRNGEAIRTDLISGFRTDGGDVNGRPVDVLLEEGGVGYISDDHAGVVYRLEVAQ